MSDSKEKYVEVVSQYVAKDLLEGKDFEIYFINKLKSDYVIMASCEKLSYDIEFRISSIELSKSLDESNKSDFYTTYNTYNVKLIDKGKLMENIQSFWRVN